MDDPVILEERDGIALLRLDAGPGNILTVEVVEPLLSAVSALSMGVDLRGVILAGRPDAFSAGIDRVDAEAPREALSTLTRLIAEMNMPVVAALEGPALAEGAELALACDAIVAAPEVVVALPQVLAGEVPSPFVAQRLAQRLPTATALAMLCLGRGQSADHADALFTKVADDPVASARALIEASFEVPGARPVDATAVRRFRARHPELAGPALWLAEAVTALAEDEAAGQAAFESALDRCAEDPLAANLRALFRAERAAPPDLLHRDGRGFRLGPRGVAIAQVLNAARSRAVAALEAREMLDDDMSRRMRDACDLLDRDLSVEARMRLLAALVSAGAKLVARDKAKGPEEVDLVAVHALGFPRISGGPMRAALRGGLKPLVEQMKRWTADDPVWEPSAWLLRESISRLRDG